MTPQTRAASRNALRTGLILFAFATVATLLLVLTYSGTAPTIARSQEAEKLTLLTQVLPRGAYDNDLLATRFTLAPDALLGSRNATQGWIARRGNASTAVILEAIAPEGYSGEVNLIIGIDISGAVTGVRVTSHRETPGLGDYIDRTKSSWVEQFVTRSLSAPLAKYWKVIKDGGQFDARAGATITPRAVVKAVRNALFYFSLHRDVLLPPVSIAPIPVQAPAPAPAPVPAPAVAPVPQ